MLQMHVSQSTVYNLNRNARDAATLFLLDCISLSLPLLQVALPLLHNMLRNIMLYLSRHLVMLITNQQLIHLHHRRFHHHLLKRKKMKKKEKKKRKEEKKN